AESSVALRRREHASSVGASGRRERDCSARGGSGCAVRPWSRGVVFKQSHLARRDPGKLLSGVQRDLELRQLERWEKTGREVASRCDATSETRGGERRDAGRRDAEKGRRGERRRAHRRVSASL